MADFLWHSVSDKEKEEIKKQAKQIIDNFSDKLSGIEVSEDEHFERESFDREEGKFGKAPIDRKIMFDNAPDKNKDFIIAEKKKW